MSLGYCPHCNAPGVSREKRPNGNDECGNGHSYPSKSALPFKDTPSASLCQTCKYARTYCPVPAIMIDANIVATIHQCPAFTVKA